MSACELEQLVLGLVRGYLPEVDPGQPLADQGLDSLAALELRQKLGEATGMELMGLIEDPGAATVHSIVSEAHTGLLAAAAAAAGAAGAAGEAGAHTGGAAPGLSTAGALMVQPAAARGQPVHGAEVGALVPAKVWISPAPVSVKMRLFCLPYAGGVSENVFARWDGKETYSSSPQLLPGIWPYAEGWWGGMACCSHTGARLAAARV